MFSRHSFSRHSKDILASFVVFLVALPLCMGISIASGVPPALGLVTGIIGGILVGAFSGSPLQVSGPAAGLTVLVFEIVREHGIEGLGPVVLIGGLLQIVAGRLRVGAWFRAMSPAVVFGMLAGIGVLILASQFHVMLDDKPGPSGIANLISIPAAIFGGIFPLDGSSHEIAALLGLLTIAILMAWDKLKRGSLTLVPGALVGVMSASAIAMFFGLKVKYVTVPENLIDVLRIPGPDSLKLFLDPGLLMSAAALAFIASAETLLSCAAVDRMQTLHKTDYDKELTAQGIGNFLAGFVGALPLTGVIVRSSANVNAGARTRLSTMLHGAWLLSAVMLLPHVLRLIPTSALGGILVYTGFKLIDIKSIKHLATFGRIPVFIYAATVVTIVCTDLLTGVITGIVLSLAKLVYRVTHMELEKEISGGITRLTIIGAATFVKLPVLATALESLPRGSEVHIDIARLAYIDHSCLDLIHSWKKQFEQNCGTVQLEMVDLEKRYGPIGKSPTLLEGAAEAEAEVVARR